MRLLLSVLGLLMVVAVVGWLSARQLSSPARVPAIDTSARPGASAPATSQAQQARQLQQDYRQAIEDAMRQPRPTGDEAR